jgi:hypothetical protein
MSTPVAPEFGTSHDVSLEEVVDTLRRNRWFVAAFLIAATVAGGVVAWYIPKSYKATIVVAPSTTSSTSGQLGGLASMASQFGGLASLAGVSLGGDSKKWESIAVLQSVTLTENYIRQNNLLPVLFYRDWDERQMRWKDNDPRKVPTLWKANRYFASRVRDIAVDNKTGLVSLTISWSDPAAAARWANGLVSLTNEFLRAKAIEESERDIAYLNDAAAKTSVVEARQTIYQLLASELNKSMIARGNDEYAFKVLDPAQVPEKSSSLPWIAWAAIALIGSVVLAVLSAVLAVSWKKK